MKSFPQIFGDIKEVINETMVNRMNAMFAFDITDEDSSWYVDLKNGSGSCGEGDPPSPPDATFKLNSETFVKMFQGEIVPSKAFMSGDLEIHGDLSKAMNLEKFMSKIQSKL